MRRSGSTPESGPDKPESPEACSGSRSGGVAGATVREGLMSTAAGEPARCRLLRRWRKEVFEGAAAAAKLLGQRWWTPRAVVEIFNLIGAQQPNGGPTGNTAATSRLSHWQKGEGLSSSSAAPNSPGPRPFAISAIPKEFFCSPRRHPPRIGAQIHTNSGFDSFVWLVGMLKYKQEDCSEGEAHRGFMDPFEVQFGDSNDSGQGVWSELSKRVVLNLSQSVFSIASFKGDVMLCACSGIVIRCEPLITTLLTSASLLRSSHDESRIEDDLTIRVRYKYQQYINGQLGDYDLDYNLLLVNIKTPPLPVARLDHQVQLESCSKVLAVGRIFNSRKLMATSGLLVKDAISIFDQEEIAISTCKISKAGIGGPLIDVDGYFHGMNFYGVEETPFLPRSIIIKCLRSFGMFRDENKEGGGYASSETRSTNSNLDASPSCGFFAKEFIDQMHDRLRSCNYPLPTTICAGMHLIHSFDQKFCKLDGSSGDFLNELSGELATNLSQNVVSLASFNGKTRWFACSGILIEYDLHTSVLTSASLVRSSDDEDTIVDNLQIEVRLPNGQCVKGTLQYCNLQFNIAVVNNMAFPDLRAANLYHPMEIKTGSEVVAVGRLFNTGRLTAMQGIVTDKKSNLDCDKLMVSTCKITKAGIGGPLVDFSGNFIGMNFYDKEETPYLPRNDILEILRQFETRGIIAADSNVKRSPSRWPVPKPYWSYPTIEEPVDPLAELSLLPMDLDSSESAML